MAFYEDRVEHFGGALVLFKRNLSVAVPNAKAHRKPNWYMRLKIGGRKGYVTRSTKLTVYEDAYEYAKSELLRLQQASLWLPVLSENAGVDGADLCRVSGGTGCSYVSSLRDGICRASGICDFGGGSAIEIINEIVGVCGTKVLNYGFKDLR